MDLLKQLLVMIGFLLPAPAVRVAVAMANYLAVGRWMRSHGFGTPRFVSGRESVWGGIASELRDRKVTYLEFGVYRGDSMRYWSQALSRPEARLHGFDSFDGLPEDGGPWSKGQFAQQGAIPQIADSRVRFFKGWFSDTLRGYAPPPNEVLFIALDADLYSSTSEVLTAALPWIKEGSWLYFDEFNHLEHEPRAFSEFLSRSGAVFEARYADRTLNFVAFRCIRPPATGVSLSVAVDQNAASPS